MEKESQPESIATIQMKSEYPPSEIYSSEPPPAYHRPQSASVQIAKIIAVTVVFVSIVLGGFMLASAYVTASASCKQLEQELQLLTETADRLQSLQPEALVQEQPKENVDTNQIDDSFKNEKDNQENVESTDADSSSENSDSTENERVTPIHIKLPMQFNMDDLTGALLDKNQRSKMNCIVEKKRAEEVVDHQPKTVRLPFGVNLTTDPRYEHVTGERMIIVCESGTLQSHSQPQPEEQEETVMIQPVVIPIGAINPFQTHMPQQQARPEESMPAPHPLETLRPPMPGPIVNQPNQESMQAPPPLFLQQIAHHLIEQRIRMQMLRAQEEARRAAQEQSAQKEDTRSKHDIPRVEFEQRMMPEGEVVMAQRIPIPDEVLRQINRLPNQEVIVSVSEQEGEVNPSEMRIIQQPRQSAQEMNGRQTYAREIPVHIPVPMMQQRESQPEQQQAASNNEEIRPHYLQPRSVRSRRSVDPFTDNQKRIKRCSCDCAC